MEGYFGFKNKIVWVGEAFVLINYRGFCVAINSAAVENVLRHRLYLVVLALLGKTKATDQARINVGPVV